MNITFKCKAKGCSPGQWSGSLQLIRSGEVYEANIIARGSFFHAIIGRHESGNFICIPNWNVGTELAALSDTFWNEERLRMYSHMKKVDACSVCAALAALSEYIKE